LNLAPYAYAVAIGVNTEYQPSNGEEESARSAIAMVVKMNRSLVMKIILLAGAATLALSAAAAFAASPTTMTDPSAAFGQAPAATYGTGGYVFPDDGAPSGDLANPITEPQQQPQQTGRFSHVYLYPPAQDGGAD
jgi:hypothetical protein